MAGIFTKRIWQPYIGLLLKSTNGGAMPASSCMGFVAQKKCWTRNLQRNAYFIQPYLIKVIRLQDISKSWGHSSLLIKLQQQLQQRRKRQDTAHVTLKLMKVNFLAR